VGGVTIPLLPPLERNLRTEVVHRTSCSSKGAETGTWNWAADKTLEQVTLATERYGWLHLCRICMPGCCRCESCREIAR
jgi:hypothetical protein